MDWLIQSGEVIDRTQGLILGKELLDQAIIKHGKERLLTMHGSRGITKFFSNEEKEEEAWFSSSARIIAIRWPQ